MQLLFVSLCLFAVLPAAQTPKPAAPPPKLTLAQALSAVPPPDTSLRLTVGADKAALPDGADPPAPGAPLSDITQAFGDITVSFGDVVAVAPATMVLLNPNPGPPDITSNLHDGTALSLLAASLSDTQWAALTSEHGLGLSDLADDTQRSLFHALFPGGHLYVGSEDPALADLPMEKRTDVRDDTDQIDTVRVRLSQTAIINLEDRSGEQVYFSRDDQPDAASRLQTYDPKTPFSTYHTVSLRAEAPNTLKPSDLDWDGRALQVAVPVAKLKTIGDLVTRIGQMTKLEMYADPHYAAKALTLSGPMTAAPAKDLLRAVCVCTTGTFRKVGPAYVLTDDLIGVGVQRKRITNWADRSASVEYNLRGKSASTLLERHAADVRKIKAFGDPLGLTPEEIAAIPPNSLAPALPDVFPRSNYPFARLTSSQQRVMQQRAEAYEERTRKSPLTSDAPTPDLTHDVNLRMTLQLQMLVSSETQAVDTNLNDQFFQLFMADWRSLLKVKSANTEVTPPLPPAPPLSPLLRAGQCRAVVGHPRTAMDVDALLVAMQKLGLNQLWLDVFSDGVNHVAASAAHGPDILTEALNKTQGTGIEVYADVSLLAWGREPPDSVRDLTIDGKDSRQEAIAESKPGPGGSYDPFIAPPVTVSPAALSVVQTLIALLQSLATRSELSGLIWEDAETDRDFGYTPEMRLAFLRTAHADPIDIADTNFTRTDLSLPLFDDAKADAALPGLWTKFHAGADTAFLYRLRSAAWRPSGPALTVLLQQHGFDNEQWFVDWNDPKQSPSLREQQADGFFVSDDKIMAIAKTPGRIVLNPEAIQNDGDTPALARRLQGNAKGMLPGSGFVLNFRHEEVTQGAAPLDSLVRAVAAEKRVR